MFCIRAIMSSTYPSFSVLSTTSSIPLHLYIIFFSFALFVFLFLLSALAILRGIGDNGYLSAASKLIDLPLLFVKKKKVVNNNSIKFYYLDFVVLLDYDCFQSFAESFVVVCYCCVK